MRHNHLSWWFPILLAVCGVLAGWLGYRRVERGFRELVAEQLRSRLTRNSAILEVWEEAQRRNAVFWAQDSRVQKLALSPEPEAIDRLRELLGPAALASGFVGFLVAGRDGVTRSALLEETTLGECSAMLARVFEGETVLCPPFVSGESLPDLRGEFRRGRITMFVVAPIQDEEGRVAASLAFRIPPESEFFPLLNAGPPGRTGEAVLYVEDGRLISPNRFGVAAGRLDVGRTSGADVAGRPDYRGVPVVAAWRWFEHENLGIMVKMDAA